MRKIMMIAFLMLTMVFSATAELPFDDATAIEGYIDNIYTFANGDIFVELVHATAVRMDYSAWEKLYTIASETKRLGRFVLKKDSPGLREMYSLALTGKVLGWKMRLRLAGEVENNRNIVSYVSLSDDN